MTPTARTVLPTDLVALVSYDGQVYANQAMTLERIGTQDSPHPLETAFEQWFSFATGRHTWISVKGPTLRGLISARKRGSKQAWEVDCLINAEEQDAGVLMSLLDQVTEAAGRSGAMRIYVRVQAGTMTEQDVIKCGFAAYRHEQVWRLERETGKVRATPEGIRRRAKPDMYPLFQLYSANVPERVRRYEAMTLTEWTAAQENMARGAQYVAEHDAQVAGWLRLASDGDVGRFDLIGSTNARDELIECALAKLANRARVHAIVPDYEEDVAWRLESLGFAPADEYTVLVRRTVRTVKAGRRVQAVAQTTFG
jgi:hypothetical protein